MGGTNAEGIQLPLGNHFVVVNCCRCFNSMDYPDKLHSYHLSAQAKNPTVCAQEGYPPTPL